MRDRAEDFAAKDVEVTVIGMGATETARRFKEQQRLPFRLLVDKKQKSYGLLGLRRGNLNEIIGPRVWAKGVRSVLRHGQGIPKEDRYQLGGVAVIHDGEVKLLHRSATSADNLPVDDLLAAI